MLPSSDMDMIAATFDIAMFLATEIDSGYRAPLPRSSAQRHAADPRWPITVEIGSLSRGSPSGPGAVRRHLNLGAITVSATTDRPADSTPHNLQRTFAAMWAPRTTRQTRG